MDKKYIENLRNFIIEQNRMFLYHIDYEITPDIEEGVEYALSKLSPQKREILIAVYKGIPNSSIAKKQKINVNSVTALRNEAIADLRPYRYQILFGKEGATAKTAEDIQRQEEWAKSQARINIENYDNPKDIRFKDLDANAISVRLYNCMSRSGLETFEMAATCNIDKIRNFGDGTKWELYCLLTNYGVTPVWTTKDVTTKKRPTPKPEQIPVPDDIAAAAERYIVLEEEALLLRKQVMDWRKDAQVTNQNCDWYKDWRQKCEEHGVK